MIDEGRLSRRGLLRLLAYWAALAGAPQLAAGQAQPSPSPAVLAAARQSAAHIGRAYVEAHPDDASVERLLSSLGLSRSELDDADVLPSGAHRERLRELHRNDFEQGRVGRLEGFTMSRTELQLAALVALIGE